ncbi:MAG: hypothetical protein Fur0037_10050 [Planctomycetota bacterium]
MRQALRLPSQRPIRGLRLHTRLSVSDGSAGSGAIWLEGLAEERRRREDERKALAAIAASVERAMQRLVADVGSRLDEVSRTAVEIGLAVAREIVGDAVDGGRFDPTPVVLRCLQDSVGGARNADLTIRLHPDDLAAVMHGVERSPQDRQRLEALQLVPDPALARGAVEAATDSGRLLWDPREVLERLSQEIRREVEA